MNNNTLFYKKYLKYKNKYLQLKGGSESIPPPPPGHPVFVRQNALVPNPVATLSIDHIRAILAALNLPNNDNIIINGGQDLINIINLHIGKFDIKNNNGTIEVNIERVTQVEKDAITAFFN